jgi:hypothetical protein
MGMREHVFTAKYSAKYRITHTWSDVKEFKLRITWLVQVSNMAAQVSTLG